MNPPNSEPVGGARTSSVNRPKLWRRPASRVLAAALLLFLALAVAVLSYARAGGLRARQKPSAMEAYLASKLVSFSVPGEAKRARNPLSVNAASTDVAAGRKLYHAECESCHGTDGSGTTAAGSGLYPSPLDLRAPALAARKRSDGELFYFIRFGVRNTGMPGWQLPDEQTWQLVSYLRNLPITATEADGALPKYLSANSSAAHYVGSAACAKCHADLYERWKRTPMANVVRDPREHPDAIIPDLTTGGDLVKFTAADVALVYGSIWKQRYFKKEGDDYFAYPAQWDVTHKAWKPYFVKDDWWAPLYPPDNFKRPTSALCDGCHSVNYDIETHSVTEWNVGCERCHGPGSEHVKNAVASAILNPGRMDYVAASDTCIQCHSQGRPLQNPIQGKYYDWPVGYDVSKRLSDFWELEEHKLGETTFTHFGDGTAHKNRMQGNDFVTSEMYAHGVTCFTCHDVHGTPYPANLRKPASTLCLDCHAPGSPNGPRTASWGQHTHHAPGSPGSECIACHMPKIAQTIGDVNVRSHTFRFINPPKTTLQKIPDACGVCHADKSSDWARNALLQWTERSPWRSSN